MNVNVTDLKTQATEFNQGLSNDHSKDSVLAFVDFVIDKQAQLEAIALLARRGYGITAPNGNLIATAHL